MAAIARPIEAGIQLASLSGCKNAVAAYSWLGSQGLCCLIVRPFATLAAAADKEILIKGRIPPEAIVIIETVRCK